MNILDSFKGLLFVNRRPLEALVRALDPDSVQILPDPGWFLDLGHQLNVWHQKYEHKKEGF